MNSEGKLIPSEEWQYVWLVKFVDSKTIKELDIPEIGIAYKVAEHEAEEKLNEDEEAIGSC